MSKAPMLDAVDESTGDDAPPPPYEAIAAPEFVVEAANVQSDGRVDIDLDSRLYRRFSKLVPVPTIDWNAEPSQELPRKHQPAEIRLNICIQVVGSRGDVQPFIALGNELQKYGHRVRLATHDVFEDFVRSSGLEFFPIGGDPAQLMAFMVKNPGLIPNMQSLRAGEIQSKRAMVEEMLYGCWRSCVEPDRKTGLPFVAEAIVANPPSFAHVHCAQALGIPLHVMFTMPWSSTRAFPHPLANMKGSRKDRQVENYLSYLVVEWLTWQGIGDLINKFRRSLDLEEVPVTEGPKLLETLNIPFTYCWSPALVPKPLDWPAHIDVCGFFFRDAPSYKPPEDLKKFLDSGPPPVYIGFGSIVVDEPEKLSATILEAVEKTGVRAIISRGWSKLGGTPSENIYYIGDCPHEWLFQQVSAVVHHGGAGTTACGLRYGKPTTIVPFFGDQPFWGSMIEAAGAGPAPITYKSLNSHLLADAIRLCLEPSTQRSAQDIARKMSTEDGVAAAVRSFHAALPLTHMRCDVLPSLPATWIYNDKKRKVKLSKKAAQMLVDYMVLDADKLKIYESNSFVIENRRYDPLTSVASSGIGTTVDMLKDATSIFTNPYEEYKKSRPSSSRENSMTITSPPPSSSSTTSTTTSSSSSITTPKKRNGLRTATAMTASSARGIGSFVGHYTKGTLVDLPLAFTEGMRGVPKLYGEPVREHAKITDWKSGVVEGGKWFARGIAEGTTDIFVRPVEGARKEGVWGAVKGLGKGSLGMVTMTSSGLMGIVAYPGQGIYRSVMTTFHTKTKKSIVVATREEMLYLCRDVAANTDNPDVVIQAFQRIRHGTAEEADPLGIRGIV